ncbi:MAG: Crp/Fnr family transcriptional regulator [Burkholderiaceae bacterium]
MLVPSRADECCNYILSHLPDSEYQAIRPHLEFSPTPLRMLLFERNKEIKYTYFPLSGEHSVLAVMEDGAAVEVGTVGNEGMSTVDTIMGSTTAIETTICQIAGESLRMPASKFMELIEVLPELHRLCFRYLQAYLSQVSQSVACNRLHTTEERFARWILMSHDRVKGNEFHITQEFLAIMLGVHRPSVTIVAKTFQQAGLIRYNRGTVMVLDRAGLEEATCECYQAVREQYVRLLGQNSGWPQKQVKA